MSEKNPLSSVESQRGQQERHHTLTEHLRNRVPRVLAELTANDFDKAEELKQLIMDSGVNYYGNPDFNPATVEELETFQEKVATIVGDETKFSALSEVASESELTAEMQKGQQIENYLKGWVPNIMRKFEDSANYDKAEELKQLIMDSGVNYYGNPDFDRSSLEELEGFYAQLSRLTEGEPGMENLKPLDSLYVDSDPLSQTADLEDIGGGIPR